MNTKEKLIDRFNEPDVHLVVSAWPEKESNHGIAWYTQLTLTATARCTGQRFVVLAERGADNRPKLFARGRILILRVFDNTRPSLYPTILTWLARFSRVRDVSVHSEFGVNAGLIHYLLLVPFLVLIRLAGRRVIYYAHNVVTDISFLRRHLNLPEHFAMTDGVNLLIRLHTKLLGTIAQRVVVLDEALAGRLTKLVDAKKIVTLPIPVEQRTQRISKQRARLSLGIPARRTVILAFGFVSAYKGTDWLMESFAGIAKTRAGRGLHLLIAGGPAHSLKDKPYYQTYYNRLVAISRQHPSITLTGFVPERDIPRYFAAADLVVLPYRGLMGASGSLAHTLAAGKPFLVSDSLKALVRQSSSQTFTLDRTGVKKIVRTLRSPKRLLILTRVSRTLASQRTVETVTRRAYNELYAGQQTAASLPVARLTPSYARA